MKLCRETGAEQVPPEEELEGGEAGSDIAGEGLVDIRLPGKGNSNSHGARPVHQIISLIK